MKSFDELTMIDDFMFGHILSSDKNLCKQFAQTILGNIIPDFDIVEIQNTNLSGFDSRGIRLDVKIKDINGKVYNLEMQTTNKDNIAKRARYYQGSIDQSLLKPGQPFKELPQSIIVFICTFDPFKRGLVRYTYEEKCIEDGMPLSDGTQKMFISVVPKIVNAIPDGELKTLLKYLYTNQPSSQLTCDIESAIIVARRNSEWRQQYMILSRYIDEIKLAEYERGLDEGEARGEINGVEKTTRLISLLLAAGDYAGIKEVTENKSAFDEYCKKYNI